jgi:ComF family protein
MACDAPLGDLPVDFCVACRQAITTDPYPSCPHCASTVAEHTDTTHGCPSCRNETYHFDATLRLGPYDGILRDCILKMKHRSGEMLAECLGDLWADVHEARFRALAVDLVLPIPLHWWRRWQRGFNQSAYLSAALARRLSVRHCPSWLRRRRPTITQTTLSAAVRRTHMKDAFVVARAASFQGCSVLLVDDVMTTGSTTSEAAKVIRAAGAKRVCVAVLARR